MVFKTAFSIWSAYEFNPMCLNIIQEESKRAVGLARPLPAISGADPWTASKMETLSPMLPDGVKPKPPINPEDKSDIISPYKLGITMTKDLYSDGSEQSFNEVLSSSSKVSLTSGYSWATSLAVSTNKPSESFIMEALCTTLTSGLLTLLAYSKAILTLGVFSDQHGVHVLIRSFVTLHTLAWSDVGEKRKSSSQGQIHRLVTFSNRSSQWTFQSHQVLVDGGHGVSRQRGLAIDERRGHVDRLPTDWHVRSLVDALDRGCNFWTNTVTRNHGDGVFAVGVRLSGELAGDLASGIRSCEHGGSSCNCSVHWKKFW
ncbi:hypothetical protein OGAPHI_002085 [Ogataea philodendri]|uniref:Uncharacterized protein n=1 Tax=Ogataea philodendri TaxID=1378263 RepID=A0A9P8T7U6_9ASCO|nr:uncharacterized protein OGAPHI_002085 [Ogataea philodendri]KAH3668331.1 hypothetical protein OGAPHI_002085 [Ogataea philodendri]